MNKVHCINVSGDCLNDEILTILFLAAQKMFKDKKTKYSFKSSICEGKISTEWMMGGIAGIYGYLFTSTLEWGQKKSKVEFTINKIPLELINPEDIRIAHMFNFSVN